MADIKELLTGLQYCAICIADVIRLLLNCYESSRPGTAIFFIQGLKTVSRVCENCKPDNLKAIRFMRKHGQKFLYGFLHKSSGFLDSKFKKLSAFFSGFIRFSSENNFTVFVLLIPVFAVF